MKITVQIVVDAGDGTEAVTYPGPVIERTDPTPATVGLHLAEAHQVLSAVQQHLVDAQADEALANGQDCPQCGRAYRHKDSRTITVRTLFGVARLPSPRWWSCPCTPAPAATFSPLADLLPERSTPELR